MKQTNEVKAVQACAAYARHAADIKALGRAIREGLEGCRSKERGDNGEKITHLSKALRESVTEDETGERRRLYD